MTDAIDTLFAADSGGGNFLVTPNVGLMIWTLIAFGIALFLLQRLAFPRIGEALAVSIFLVNRRAKPDQGRPPPDSPILAFQAALTNPYKIDGAEGALADDMRIKLLYDLAYTASLEKFSAYASTELGVLWRTPLKLNPWGGPSVSGDTVIVSGGSIGYYLNHREEVDAYLAERARQAAELRREIEAAQRHLPDIRQRVLDARKVL